MRAAAAVVLLLCGCNCSKPAAPFVRQHADGEAGLPCLFWPSRALTYAVDPAGSARTPADTERAAVDSAFASWSSAAAGCSDLTFSMDAGSRNLVVWRERSCTGLVPPGDPCLTEGDCDVIYGCWDDPEDTLAITTVTYSRSLGTLFDADIKLNGAGWLYTTVDAPPCPMGSPGTTCVATDVQNTVTHEIGHLLGFAHADGKGSTMAAFAPQGDLTKRVIDDGTKEGLCTIYPRGAPSPSCTSQ